MTQLGIWSWSDEVIMPSVNLTSSQVRWKDGVDEHDYAAALDYLSLLLDADRAKIAVKKLKKAPLVSRRANDILRACGRVPLGPDDPGVAKNLDKVAMEKELSPVLVVSFAYSGDIADGYHRVSTAYLKNPFSYVPCKLVHAPELR